MEEMKKRIGEIVLITPLLGGFLWFSGLVIKSKSQAASGELLSPGQISPLVTGIFIFIIIYSLFLMLIFWDMYRKHKKTEIKETKKKPAKKTRKRK